jgi:hypothetical protein
MTSRDNYSNGRTAGARCMCRRVDFQGEWVTFYTHPF